MQVTRRLFIKDGAIAIASVGLAPAMGPVFLRTAAYAREPDRSAREGAGRKTLICIFQRGAVDGLSMVAPHGDPHYYEHRPVGPGGIAIARTGQDGVIDLDGMFGLHPSLAPLKPIWDARHLAVVHACGSPNPTRSHFDAQDFMESGAPGNKAIRTGWLARTSAACPEDRARAQSLFRTVSMTTYLPRSLQGDREALAVGDLRSFGLEPDRAPVGAVSEAPAHDGTTGSAVASAFREMYAQDTGDIVHGTGRDAFAAMRIAKQVAERPYSPANGARYPRTPLGTSLQQIAQLVKANVGLEIGFAEVGGWDTHVRQGGAQGVLATRLRDLGEALAALHADLGDRMADVVVLTMSEFGRTARQNGSDGTDHGHGTCFLAMGGGVSGGKVLGPWPGLAPEQLYENRDLAVTTDFRDVFAEVAQRHLGVRSLAGLFPGYAAGPTGFRGILAAA